MELWEIGYYLEKCLQNDMLAYHEVTDSLSIISAMAYLQ